LNAMNRELFGTDGVRGMAGDYPLDREGSIAIGLAIGKHFGQPGQTVVIASDPRESSAELVANVSEGLVRTGLNVVNAGVLPTPGLAYLTREGDYCCGVMITASHNPREYNGVKCFDSNGDKLSDEIEAKLNELIVNPPAASREEGTLSNDETLINKYEDFLVQTAGDFNFNKSKIALDSANGASSKLAQRVFSRLGADVVPMFDQPDGRNINDGCGATNTTALRGAVTSGGFTMGAAFDGDADRVALIDSEGRELDGDHIIYILAVTQGLPGVVVTVMTNQGTEDCLKRKGIEVNRVKVGDRYVLEGLAQTGYKVGGEQAGHIILYNLLKTGDGLLAAVQTLKAVAESGKTLAEWRDEVKLLPQALVNIPLPNKALLDKPGVKAYLDEQTKQLEGSGRLLIRPSGTEPLARVMVEANGAENLARQIADELSSLIKGQT
jgi:phosphoglucosamine mutase